ncbi:L,D-transpeptidase family protein [Streptomyces sp. ODS28]|uniref:L,D-transpeptidase family protein n=1 Tax=Streptomyces sp. ODS28 TaxID=3136688 RepID=UPI0031ECDBB2
MRISGTRRARRTAPARYGTAAAASATALALGLGLAGCGSGGAKGGGSGERSAEPAARAADPTRIPDVGDRMQSKIPDSARQVVAVYGKGADSPDNTVQLFTRRESKGKWTREASWSGHNGRKGWTPDHRQDDKRSPVGVFTLSDAGGMLPEPKGTKLPYEHSTGFTPSPNWPKATRHDFDHVVAVDYNRVKGRSPLDMTRPQGDDKGGSIWLHMDHGSGTSGCVSISKSGMRKLLGTLDPKQHPVVVMGDKASLSR